MTHPAVSGISVVIPNYNGRHLLEEILQPLLSALKETGLPYEVIVSDDKSTDDSIAFLRARHSGVKLIVNETNRGFAPTINQGIFTAQYSHLLLLNSDVKLTPGFFANQFRYFEKTDTFGVMGRIVGWEDETIQDGGKYPSFHGLKIKTSGNYIPMEERRDQWLYSMYLSGANAFVDRQKMLLLGGFDELFAPFYVEDYELSLRAWRFGWKCYYDHSSICRHKESVTIKSKAKKNEVNTIYYRNKMYLHALHLSGASLVAWHVQLFFEALLNLFVLRFYFLRSIVQYLKHFSLVKQRRKAFRELANAAGKPLLSLKQVTEDVLSNINRVAIKSIK